MSNAKQRGDVPAEIRDGLAATRAQVAAVFKKSHDANEDAGQKDQNLREVVAQVSAALTALDRAAAAAARAASGFWQTSSPTRD